MGFSTDIWLEEHLKMMKFIAIACLVAVASAEAEADADAGVLYGAYGYTGYPTVGYAGYGYGLGAYGYGLGAYRYGYGYPAYGYYGKRSADAEPEADAEAGLLYSAYG